MFRVVVKPSALEVNANVEAFVEERGQVVEFESRSVAEAIARELSADADRVRIQTVAPQDPDPVDGYLVRFPRQSKRTPAVGADGTMRFDVTANQYGAIGESLIFGRYGVAPPLRYAFCEELHTYDPGAHRLAASPEAALPDDVPPDVSWCPDCRVRILDRRTGTVVAAYFCEIKTGKASFQRGQLADMARVAERYDVLKIRVTIASLPETYTVRIDRISPGTSTLPAEGAHGRIRSE